MKFHCLCVMRLTSTDYRRARICHQVEVILLRGTWNGIITLIPLKRGDHHIAFSFQLIDLLREIWEITGRSTGLKIGCRWKAIDIGLVAADKCNLIAIDLK